jgi:hypothetical protein
MKKDKQRSTKTFHIKLKIKQHDTDEKNEGELGTRFFR